MALLCLETFGGFPLPSDETLDEGLEPNKALLCLGLLTAQHQLPPLRCPRTGRAFANTLPFQVLDHLPGELLSLSPS